MAVTIKTFHKQELGEVTASGAGQKLTLAYAAEGSHLDAAAALAAKIGAGPVKLTGWNGALGKKYTAAAA